MNQLNENENSATESNKPAQAAVNGDRLGETSIFGKAPKLSSDLDGYFDVRPIATPRGLKELSKLHRRTWQAIGVDERAVYTTLWPVSLHFGLYWVKPGEMNNRPPLVGAFWARCLADAPLTIGHLYPPAIFRKTMANEVYEFGGMVLDPTVQKKGLARTL